MAETETEFWRLLDDFEDLLKGNYRLPHSKPPALRRRRASASAGGESSKTPDTLEKISAEVRACTACRLSSLRRQAVPGDGNPAPRVVVIGEGPGAQEDQSGRPFVGRAGQYLDKWLDAIGIGREESVFITNVIKCRPPGNRDPEEEEMRACFPYLLRQLALLRPEAILCVGRYAARRISGQEGSLGSLRGQEHTFQGIPVVVTYHPSAVLRNSELRRPVWDDLQRLKELLERS